jgi:hypothetical protein
VLVCRPPGGRSARPPQVANPASAHGPGHRATADERDQVSAPAAESRS